MKYSLCLKQNLPFADCPRIVELDESNIVCNDIMLPADIDNSCRYNPHNVRLWVIGHEHGAICAIFASHEQEAFDNAVDANKLNCLMLDEETDDCARLGNASEPFDLSYAWIGEVEFNPARDILLITALARAAESERDNLS